MTRAHADVTVIGGGPAGSVFAIRMAQLGFDVCLVERSRFPRPHLGESLSPGVMPMLASIGAVAAVEAAGFRRVHQVSTNWDGPEAVRSDPHAEGLLVDRGAFDAALLARARTTGVRVLQPARVRAPARTPEGWRLRVEAPGETIELDAVFLADGSGRASCLGGARRAMGPRTVALHGYWTGGGLPEQPRIEAGACGWCWGVPIPDGSTNTLVFVDVEWFRAERAAGTLDDRLRGLLGPTTLLRGVRGATLRGPARAVDATPYVHEDCVGQRHIRIGDAALALDPLSSSGVQKAIQTALSGAIVANTLLRQPAAGGAAVRFYRDSIRETAARHRAWATSHYATAAASRPDPFWTTRAVDPDPTAPASRDDLGDVFRDVPGDDVPVQVSADCQWEDVPCLGAHFVELKSALRHRGVDGSLAYLGGHQLAPLLRHVPAGVTPRQLAQTWSGSIPIGTGLSIARWLAARGVLERCAVEGGP